MDDLFFPSIVLSSFARFVRAVRGGREGNRKGSVGSREYPAKGKKPHNGYSKGVGPERTLRKLDGKFWPRAVAQRWGKTIGVWGGGEFYHINIYLLIGFWFENND